MITSKSYSTHAALIIVLILFLAAPRHLSAQYSSLKHTYNYQDYTHEDGQPYIPVLSGVASLIIPGLGQVFSGEIGRGVGFFVGEFTSLSMFVVGFGLAWGGYDIAGPIMVVSAISAFTIPIWSSVNAVRIAKVKNMDWSDKNRLSTGINLSPGLKLLPNQKVAPAITLSLNF